MWHVWDVNNYYICPCACTNSNIFIILHCRKWMKLFHWISHKTWRRNGRTAFISCGHWKDAGTFPPPNAKELDICVTVNWHPPALSVSLDSEEEREGCSGGGWIASMYLWWWWGSKNVILVNTATYSAKYLSLPSHAPALHSLLPTWPLTKCYTGTVQQTHYCRRSSWSDICSTRFL